MATPHNKAEKGEIAKTVLMPGDPLRAKFIAENFLTNITQFNDVRNMFGYTGEYNGVKVSVMGSGMGMPSIGIYSYELYANYDVENIIRIGSAGSYCDEAKVFDVILASSAYSESSFAKTQNGYDKDTTYPSEKLCDVIRASAKKLNIPLIEGKVHSSDVFYRNENIEINENNTTTENTTTTENNTTTDNTTTTENNTTTESNGINDKYNSNEKNAITTEKPQNSNKKFKHYYESLYEEKGCLCVEMESFALFHNASVLGKNAACILTISDSFVSSEVTTALERQNSFTTMMRLALDAAISL